MAGRYKKTQEKNRSRFYFLLSVIFIFIVVKWGFPLFIRIIAGDGVTIKKTVEDIIPPQTPILSPLPEATNEAKIIIAGYTESGANIEVNVNDVLVKTDKADVDGSFKTEVDIQNGQNRVQVRATDQTNNSSMSDIKLVLLDKTPVLLTINSPKDGTEYIGKNSQVIEISGKVNKNDVSVLANNLFVEVDRDGSFTHKFSLNSGENEVKVVASDKAGNTDEVDFKLTYSP